MVGTRRVIREFATRPGRRAKPHPRSRAIIKLAAQDRAQLVGFAYQSGLVD